MPGFRPSRGRLGSAGRPATDASNPRIGHPTKEVHGEATAEAMRLWNERGGTPVTDRSRQELARFFDRLELLEPGVVSCSRWWLEPADSEPAEVSEFCAVGRKQY
jgi:hypothetical protein